MCVNQRAIIVSGTCLASILYVPHTPVLFSRSFWVFPDYGFSVGEVKFDWKVIKAKRDAYVDRLTGIYEVGRLECLRALFPFSFVVLSLDRSQHTRKTVHRSLSV